MTNEERDLALLDRVEVALEQLENLAELMSGKDHGPARFAIMDKIDSLGADARELVREIRARIAEQGR